VAAGAGAAVLVSTVEHEDLTAVYCVPSCTAVAAGGGINQDNVSPHRISEAVWSP